MVIIVRNEKSIEISKCFIFLKCSLHIKCNINNFDFILGFCFFFCSVVLQTHRRLGHGVAAVVRRRDGRDGYNGVAVRVAVRGDRSGGAVRQLDDVDRVVGQAERHRGGREARNLRLQGDLRHVGPGGVDARGHGVVDEGVAGIGPADHPVRHVWVFGHRVGPGLGLRQADDPHLGVRISE